ncbi:hypothetical protein BJX64DRAFT_287717 [Aspergillus heterothallicus]
MSSIHPTTPTSTYNDHPRAIRMAPIPASTMTPTGTHTFSLPPPVEDEDEDGHENKHYQGVVIFFHSVGFTSGDLETEDVSCRYMTLLAQAVVFSVDYRLSPGYQYPFPINDGIRRFRVHYKEPS